MRAHPDYEVLCPWGEADPLPIKGLSVPRLSDLSGKRIGLYVNDKRAAQPILSVVEKQLMERFPSAEVRWFKGPKADTRAFTAWLTGVDAVVAAVGD